MSRKIFDKNDFLYNVNADFIEDLYSKYSQGDGSIESTWVDFFSDIEKSNKDFKSFDINAYDALQTAATAGNSMRSDDLQIARQNSINLAALDPLGIKNPINFNLNLDKNLQQIYTGAIAVEFEHLPEGEKNWLYSEFESNITIDNVKKIEAIKTLIEIKDFEHFLHLKFPGAKRFSIEGSECALLALHEVVSSLTIAGTQDITLAMAHRGRLNALAGVMQKPVRAILAEFMGKSPFPKDFGVWGDVKYHLGWHSKRQIAGRSVNLSLLSNPSHLESVNPVLLGAVRAKSDAGRGAAGIILHGDAAFAGQGVVMESLAMSRLDAYKSGGIIHIIINNQIGFTTDTVDATGAGGMQTDPAKMIAAPVIHVNGHHPLSVIRAAQIASGYRQKFGKDVVLDVIGYRKYGHNEGDEPSYTQKSMYEIIKQIKPVSEIFAKELESQNIVDAKQIENIKSEFRSKLDKELSMADSYVPEISIAESWQDFIKPKASYETEIVKTGIGKDKFKSMGLRINTIPQSIQINKKLTKLLEKRRSIIESGEKIDWAVAEQMAFASILSDEVSVRVCGQDAQRGTFSHRHSVLHTEAGAKYIPLEMEEAGGAKFSIYNSHLSEFAALGFEYGYSLNRPRQLVVWEAQFGDFINGAQIIIDQYITSSFEKWLERSPLVMLLPHASEGQGPEHSSARLERFLQLCARRNICVANITTPAGIFHALRRQVMLSSPCPLIIMSPKSLLRHPMAVSDVDEFTSNSSFVEIIDDTQISKNKVKRLVFCSGKVYYDLLSARSDRKIEDTALIRIEQLYPLNEELISSIIKKYGAASDAIWCQEEPENMGAWWFMRGALSKIIVKANKNLRLVCAARQKCSSPAEGSASAFAENQEKLIFQALGVNLKR